MSDSDRESNDAPTGVPAPGAEHERLLRKVGVWDVDCYYHMSPEEPVRAQGVERVEAVGGYWTIGRFEVELHGRRIEGRSVTGYDPVKLGFIGSWFDSATPFFYYFEGQFDDENGVLTMEGDNTDPMSGNLVLYRSEEEFVDEDHRVLSLFVESPPGNETQILRYEFTRRK